MRVRHANTKHNTKYVICTAIINVIVAIFIMHSIQIKRKQTADAYQLMLPPYSPSLENEFF